MSDSMKIKHSDFKELPIISGGITTRTPTSKDPIVGIDLGTTNSLIAFTNHGITQILESKEGHRLMPSVVHFNEDQSYEVGNSAKQKRNIDPKNTIFSVKRLLGKNIDDAPSLALDLPYKIDASGEKNIFICVGNKKYTPIEISSLILRNLKESAELNLDQTIEDVVITVPAYFNDSQRQATRAAGILAGLNVLRILNEPTAAALAYGSHYKKNGLLAVYDFGGGTFDISILRIKDGIFEVLSTGGDTKLGGDDIDLAISNEMKQVLLKKGVSTKEIETSQAQLLVASEKLKKTLSEKNETNIQIVLSNGQSVDVTLRSDDLERISKPYLVRTEKAVDQAMRDAKVGYADLTDVLLVGGSTKMPCVRHFVENIFGKKPNVTMNPEEVVAIGAAIQGDILAGNNEDFLLLDVVPLSLGMETLGGAMNKLIPRNTRIPAMAKEYFTTSLDGQTKVAINIFQGERDLVAHNRRLGEFILSGFPALPAGLMRIEVTFLVDADGILSVSAKELSSGAMQSVEVRPTYGLTDEEVEKKLREYIENKDSDLYAAQLLEAINSAHLILGATEKSLTKLRHQIDSQIIHKVETLVENLKKSIAKNQLDEIRKSYRELDEGTQGLAENLMQETLDNQVRNREASTWIETKQSIGQNNKK